MKSTTPMSDDKALAAVALKSSADAIAKASRPAPPPKELPVLGNKVLQKAPPPAPQ